MSEMSRGAYIRADINQGIINTTIPCDKHNCMVAVGVNEALKKKHGGGRGHFYVAATNNGVKFTVGNWRYEATFGSATATKIAKFDTTFRRAESEGIDKSVAIDLARSAIKPFEAELSVLKRRKIASAEASERSRLRKRELRAIDKASGVKREKKKGSFGRQISM